MLPLLHAGPTVLAAFLASLVEFVEALTVILAVASVRGWRPALAGAGAGLLLLSLMVLLFGPALAAIPLQWIQLAAGTLLLLFGLRWLRKAVLRAAGFIPLHDEEAAFAKERALLRRAGTVAGHWRRDGVAMLSAFKIVLLEGVEVVFIVIAMGAGGRLLLPAAAGALAALLLVILLGVWLHKPLSTIPENQLKFGVGVLLCAFGTFWVGEGLGAYWPGADWSIAALIAAYGVLAAVLAWRLASGAKPGAPGVAAPPSTASAASAAPGAPAGWLVGAARELAGLFIDDGLLATGTLAWIAFACLWQSGQAAVGPLHGAWFFAGLAALLVFCCRRAAAELA